MQFDEIVEVQELGYEDCYDITMYANDFYSNEPNFVLDGVVVHNCGMHNAYCDRKKGKEEYTIPPALEKYMDYTYGVMVYQEQVIRALNIIGGIPERDCDILRKAISKKKMEKFAKYQEMFMTNAQKVHGFTEQEAKDFWSQIESWSGYGFNKAHSYAYSHVSMCDLYLKCHFPIEFFVKSLQHNCVDGADRDKTFREYKRVIENKGIRVKRVDINKSGVGFEIVDDAIYTGFSVLKGVGVDVAQKIVNGQPYSSFEDFLKRFGMDAKVVRPLISLGVFNDADPITLYKFYEFLKDATKKRADRFKRYTESIARYQAELQAIAQDVMEDVSFSEECLEALRAKLDDEGRKKLKSLEGRRNRSMKGHEFKSEFEQYNTMSLKEFNPEAYPLEIDPELEELLTCKEVAERQFYGFCWTHPIENCKHNMNLTIENYKSEDCSVPIEGLVTHLEERQGKKSVFYSLTLEDMNWETLRANIWSDEYKHFQKALTVGNIIRIRLQPPMPPYNTYTLESIPGYKPWMKKKPNLEHDYRIQLLEAAPSPVQKKDDLVKEISEAIL